MKLLTAFHKFCAKQPARRKYEYGNACGCALAQFAKTIGTDWSQLASYDHGTDEGLLLDMIAMNYPRTFGALTKRLARQIKSPRTRRDWVRLNGSQRLAQGRYG